VLDEIGADKLLGNGDLLFLRPGTSSLIRGQGTYLSDDEIARVIDAVATSEPQFVEELVQLKTTDSEPEGRPLSNRDELYEAAVDVVVREGRGSVSLLQRALGIGYGRAARLIDYMAEDGIVGPYNGSQAREVLLGLEEWDRMHAQREHDERGRLPRRRSNTILLSRPGGTQFGVDRPTGLADTIPSAADEPTEEDFVEDEHDEDEEYDAEDAYDESDAEEDVEDEYDEIEDADHIEDEEDEEDEYDDCIEEGSVPWATEGP